MSSRFIYLFEKKVLSFSKRHLNFPIKSVGVCCSAGPDSVALFLWSFFILKKNSLCERITLIHFEHEQREKKIYEQEKKFILNLGQKYDCDVLILPIKKKNSNREALLRQERLGYLSKMNFDLILQGHHLDDALEWTLMKYFSTSHWDLGIPVKRGKIFRPFFCVSKASIKKYLKAYKQDFFFDESNKDVSYDRNFLRKILITVKERYPQLLTHYVQRQLYLKKHLKRDLLREKIYKLFSKRPKLEKNYSLYLNLKKNKKYFSLDLEKDYKLYFAWGKTLLDKGLKKVFYYQEGMTKEYSLESFKKIFIENIHFPYYIALDSCPFEHNLTFYKKGLFGESFLTNKKVTLKKKLETAWTEWDKRYGSSKLIVTLLVK